jgi:hypothetical protein
MNIKKKKSGRAAISCQEKSSSKNGDSFVNITHLRLIFSPWLRRISLSLFAFFLVPSVKKGKK